MNSKWKPVCIVHDACFQTKTQGKESLFMKWKALIVLAIAGVCGLGSWMSLYTPNVSPQTNESTTCNSPHRYLFSALTDGPMTAVTTIEAATSENAQNPERDTYKPL
jgi:hypothetical protein